MQFVVHGRAHVATKVDVTTLNMDVTALCKAVLADAPVPDCGHPSAAATVDAETSSHGRRQPNAYVAPVVLEPPRIEDAAKMHPSSGGDRYAGRPLPQADGTALIEPPVAKAPAPPPPPAAAEKPPAKAPALVVHSTTPGEDDDNESSESAFMMPNRDLQVRTPVAHRMLCGLTATPYP